MLRASLPPTRIPADTIFIGINEYIAICIHDLWHLLFFLWWCCACVNHDKILFSLLSNGPIFNFIRPFFRHIVFIFHSCFHSLFPTDNRMNYCRRFMWFPINCMHNVLCGDFKWHSVNLGHLINVFFNTHDCKLFSTVWKMMEIIIINSFVSTEFYLAIYFWIKKYSSIVNNERSTYFSINFSAIFLWIWLLCANIIISWNLWYATMLTISKKFRWFEAA